MPKKTGMKGGRSKASYRKAALKGWRTRRAKLAELDAVEVRSGYDGRGQNSYTLIVHMLRPKGLDDQDLSNLVEKMATQGKFDAAGKKWTNDLRWASFHNNFTVTKISHAPAKPKLVGFERKRP